MPIDSDVYFKQRSPDIMGSFERGTQMADLMDKRKLEKKKLAEEEAVKNAYRQNFVTAEDGSVSLNRKGLMSELAQLSPDKALAQQEQFKSQDAASLKQKYEQLDMSARLLGGVKDQATWTQNRQKAIDMGIAKPSDLPEAYDQKFVNYLNGSVLTGKERLDEDFRRAQLADQRAEKVAQRDHEINLEAAKSGATQAFEYGKQERQFKHEKDMQNIRGTQSEKLKAIADANRSKSGGLSEGEKKVDQDYAKDYNDFTGGGYAKAQDAIGKLEALKNQMASDKGFVQAGGGPISGSLPDAFRSQKSIAQRDNIISVANSALKATFGGQLSDGERKALANEFYNDKLDNQENLKIIEQKIAELKNGLQAQTAKAQHYQMNRGSLKGFQYQQAPYSQAGNDQTRFKTSEIEWAD